MENTTTANTPANLLELDMISTLSVARALF
jgi:hypothetical protein